MPKLKTCRLCKQTLDLMMFSRLAIAPDGLRYECKTCCKAESKRWYEENKEHRNKVAMEWAANNKDKTARYQAKYAETHKAERRAKALANYHADKATWRERNKEFYRNNRWWGNEKIARRKAAKRSATPAWVDKKAVQAIYRQAREVSAATGVRHHVDHIVPLRSDRVCGFHVEHNLRIISGVENSSKGNRHWPDMPDGKEAA